MLPALYTHSSANNGGLRSIALDVRVRIAFSRVLIAFTAAAGALLTPRRDCRPYSTGPLLLSASTAGSCMSCCTSGSRPREGTDVVAYTGSRGADDSSAARGSSFGPVLPRPRAPTRNQWRQARRGHVPPKSIIRPLGKALVLGGVPRDPILGCRAPGRRPACAPTAQCRLRRRDPAAVAPPADGNLMAALNPVYLRIKEVMRLQ